MWKRQGNETPLVHSLHNLDLKANKGFFYGRQQQDFVRGVFFLIPATGCVCPAFVLVLLSRKVFISVPI